ncbi:hypothetical protein DYQ86_06500 [Acidobacteria bacterium AB60]|nr:hypothetical protein DYQ86_06500 [Acidobacteria bacterium AB60]
MAKELSSFSSVRFNNFLLCVLFIMSASVQQRRFAEAFWETFLFQLFLLTPILITSSIDAQQRLPGQRVRLWPLTEGQRLLLTFVSFVLNPFFVVLFVGYLFWMGLAIAFCFVVLGVVIHAATYATARLRWPRGRLRRSWLPMLPMLPWKYAGIVRVTVSEVTSTLDFWTAILIAASGTAYRLFGHSPEPEAFPMLSLLVGIAMSTMAQRMLSMDEGRAMLRYRMLPIDGWKLLVVQDAVLVLLVGIMVLPLNLQAGLAFSLVAIAVGRYPSLKQQTKQRRWRFVGGDPRFGVVQVLLGVAARIGAARIGLSVLAYAFLLYAGSVFWGHRLWKRLRIS